MIEVRRGDIILHGVDGYIKAISTAKGECYDRMLPEEFRREGMDFWELDGRCVDCDYTYIDAPIRPAAFADDIVRLSPNKYSPFKRDGSGGNMGYLFDLNRDLAKVFIKEIIAKNSYIGDLDYIRELIDEGI